MQGNFCKNVLDLFFQRENERIPFLQNNFVILKWCHSYRRKTKNYIMKLFRFQYLFFISFQVKSLVSKCAINGIISLEILNQINFPGGKLCIGIQCNRKLVVVILWNVDFSLIQMVFIIFLKLYFEFYRSLPFSPLQREYVVLLHNRLTIAKTIHNSAIF